MIINRKITKKNSFDDTLKEKNVQIHKKWCYWKKNPPLSMAERDFIAIFAARYF